MRNSLRLHAVGLALFLAACGGGPNPTPDGGAPVACKPGTQGCPCAGGQCAKSASGESLVCMGDVCEAMSCPAGTDGCVCRKGTECNSPSAACTNGFCLAANCTVGGANCACIAGTCSAGLTCVSDTVCVDSLGYEGGACLANGSCHRGSRCDKATLTCVYCDPGTPGCQCTTPGGCNAGLVCAAGACLPSSALPPANPVCYTPCPQMMPEGTTCPSDGLRPGCFDGQTCTKGSCLNPGGTKATCANDLGCPFFQVCLSGGCYSNCDVNADCPSGLGCYKHACRPTCSVATLQAACPAGSSCTSNDGKNGFCTPSGVGASGTMASVNPTGGLGLSTPVIGLSNVKASASFLVLSKSEITQDVVIRKKWHKVNYANSPPGARVDAPLAADGVTYTACNAAAGECPLAWLTLGVDGAAPSSNASITYRLPPNCVDDSVTQVPDGGAVRACPHVNIGSAGGADATSWEGELEISSTQGATITVHLSYVQRPDGQWVGSMFYFGTFKTTGMPAWIARTDKSQAMDVDNALIQRWASFRANNLNGWEEFRAVLTSTREGSWDFPIVRAKCATLNFNSLTPRCYPYTNSAGVRTYVANPDVALIPSGVVELPIGFNLQLPDPANAPTKFKGRLESSLAMHYPGNPEVKLELESDPTNAGASTPMGVGGDRLVFLKNINAVAADANRLTSTVGGRLISADGNCPGGDAGSFVPVKVPWLVPGFTDQTNVDLAGVRTRTECRETKLPFNTALNEKNFKVNTDLSGGNPVPDGSPRVRTLRFIDGALVNQTELFVLFEESYESFIPGQPATTAYGYMTLKRAPASLTPADYVGRPTTTAPRTAVTPGATCSLALVNQVLNTNFQAPSAAGPLTPAQMGTLIDTLIVGGSATAGYVQVTSPGDQINYYCEGAGGTDGFFNGGKDEFTLSIKKACPPGSKIVYFNSGTNKTPQQIANDPCMNGGSLTCWETLQAWKNGPTVVTEYEPFYRCTNTIDGGNNNYCDDNRFDLRLGKTFYRKAPATAPPMLGLNALIDRAFRYKTRFRASTGGTLGFAPRQCIPNSDSIPYCYDPAEIQQARDRIDCLIDLYSRTDVVVGPNNTPGTLPDPYRTQLLGFLRANFSAFPNTPGPGGVTQIQHDAFERLYAELLIMQGDESLTSAYASRFDLAATGGASFKGSAFEANGIDLTGVAGAELFQLYQSIQYYQLALDRLYLLGANMGKAQGLGVVGSSNNFITAETVTSYLERLVRAAAQKSRAWGEVARRYQNFNRPDLARTVIERAYVSTYVESALISRVMQEIAAGSGAASQAQMRLTIEKTQRSYRMALLDMREIYAQISDELNFFGFPADYIPFPALDSNASGGAFDSLLALSKQRLELAKQREVIALSSGKQGRVDAAQFQADLVSLRNTYENQLAQACGTFKGDDGLIYPAILKYSPQSAITLQLGDPCARMGNGDIHNAALAAQDNALKVAGVLQRHANILQDVSNEQQRMAAVCGVMAAQVDYTFKQAGVTSTMQNEIADQRATTAFITGSIGAVIAGLQATSCELPAGCVKAAITGAAVATMGVTAAGAQYSSDTRIADKEAKLRNFEASSVQFAGSFQCNLATANDGGIGQAGLGIVQIESNARVASMLNDTLEVQIEALRADYALRGAVAEVQRMYNNAKRLQNQYEEAQSLSIDVQQAQNDPNVRIYQNDSIINADVSFSDALATAYRATRVYEYYTSQSYAKKEQLFLIRMVSAGQYNLENYLLQLENEFLLFEEQFGNPDLRVLVLSLRDDIMSIPYLGTDKQPLTEDVRINMLREKLKDPKRLDSRGYLTLPFSTTIGDLSPVTRNHKVHHVEVDLQGVRMGDALARVYLRSAGTGVVRNVHDDLDYYVFPERLGVINASVGGAKVFDAEVYRNYRFRDRPMVNTLWELVINRRNETVNKDIDLATLSDVRVLIYYSDFTSF